ncbi:O-antigen ligase family protein [Patescibacteria group bacterium]|nr:O-antigen ligase family protein [Patescibacteria group bacterium]
MTGLILILIPFSVRLKFKIRTPDILILLFYIWCFVIFLIYPYANVLYGFITISEILLVYFLLRINLDRDNFRYVVSLIISLIVFQLFIGGLQFVLKRPLGIIAESSILQYPYGLITAEDINLFRVTGTFGDANMLAVTILSLLPFLFVFRIKFVDFLKVSLLELLFFTYSRAEWAIGAILFLFLIFRNKEEIIANKKYLKHILFFCIACIIFLLPGFIARLETVPQAFMDGGSMDTRFKLLQESSKLIFQYPVIGVGINRFQEVAGVHPVTDIFATHGFYAGTKVHNLFFEMATEIGIPGLVFFILFLLYVFEESMRKKNPILGNVVFSLIAIILASMFHPLFQSMQFRLYFLLSAIILV